ncbi:MAG: HNH endonuclease [Candidatus Heimdallarchaeota archaeon]|nr:HNH endonuclease [Candidatus Heimdallarchaeota archaeon]
MQVLPFDKQLNIDNLSACFNNVTNSYKFFWFLSILDDLRTKKESKYIFVDHLCHQMVVNAWVPHYVFKLNLGTSDGFKLIFENINVNNLPKNSREISKIVLNEYKENEILNKKVNNLGRYVPYRFLRPFFPTELKGLPDHKINDKIKELSNNNVDENINLPLYKIIKHGDDLKIEIHQQWKTYLLRNLKILYNFIQYNLIIYLSRLNPNVPNISQKFELPQKRYLNQAKRYWKIALSEIENPICIYSSKSLKYEKQSLDHFLPWRYVAHDLIWNIIPTLKSINSSKYDRLPNLNKYLSKFIQIQFDSFKIVSSKGNEKLIEDYILLFNELSPQELMNIDFKEFSIKLQNTLQPQAQIAVNLGFESNWEYH